MSGLNAQEKKDVSLNFIEKEYNLLPGQITNLTFFLTNNTADNQKVKGLISVPDGWKIIFGSQELNLSPTEKKLLIYTIQVPYNYPVGKYNVNLSAVHSATNDTIDSYQTTITVNEIEDISMSFVNAPDNLVAGEIFKATYMIQNLGNTKKKVFIETVNCDVEGTSEIELNPAQSTQFGVYKQIPPELANAMDEYFTVRATVAGKIMSSIFRSATVFPAKGKKPDLYFRFPVKVSASYLTSKQQGNFESVYQFQLSGSGPLDPEGKHNLEFMARGPNNANLSYLGLYDQYYVSYSNKNLELFAGEKAYLFTPLTESSRFGMGAETKLHLNNGLSFGFIYVKPRFYEEIKNEMAGFTSFAFDKENEMELLYVAKNNSTTNHIAHLFSLNGQFTPIKKTKIDIEYSRGLYQETWDNAFSANLSSQFSIFQFAGNYFYTGKNYPGYFSNSSFYSGNFSAQITKKISVGVYAKEDFQNAELDTFFVTAPYAKSFQSVMNYNLSKRAYLRFYLRAYESKDRLALDKFHYTTNSFNTQFNHQIKKIEYNLLGEIGKTTNLLLETEQNQQNTFRGTTNFSYRFNSKHSVRLFGSWSNINSFVTGEQRNLTAGLSVASQISKNFKADFHIQNAYDIDDYYQNRNLMQLNINYNFLKKHSLSLSSFYTIFRQKLEDPEFTLSLTYAYTIGLPVKQIINAGDLKGRITYDNEEPAEGIVLNIQNKKAITNKNGEFWFNTLQAGVQFLFVDRTNFEIDEITNIKIPIEVEIIEDEETDINFKITRGSKFDGKLVIVENEMAVLNKSETSAANIIVELKNEFEQFRIATGVNGNFSFPIVRPGNWIFKIYPGSIPSGYEVQQTEYPLNLKPGENQNLQIEIKSKKRNIIFKSESTILTPAKKGDTAISIVNTNSNGSNDSIYYSIQVGTFLKKQTNNTGYFEKVPYDFEIKTDNYYKYFIGKFNSYKVADLEKNRLKSTFKNSSIVVLKNNEK